MLKRTLLAFLVTSGAALAQTAPSPTFQAVTINTDPSTGSHGVRKSYLDTRLGSYSLTSALAAVALSGSAADLTTGLLPVARGGTGTASPGIVAGANIAVTGTWPTQTVAHTGTLPVASGGTGTTSPGLVAGTNITSITGTWPNQTINATGGSGSPGGSSGMLQYNNAGSFGGLTIGTTLANTAGTLDVVGIATGSLTSAGAVTPGTDLLVIQQGGTDYKITPTAFLASAALGGNPTATTQAPGTNNTRIATTAYADAAVAAGGGGGGAPTANPTFTGSVRVSLTDSITAAGTTLGTATALTAQTNVVTTTASGTGVSLQALTLTAGSSAETLVVNAGANALTVYPATSGGTIDGGTAGVGVTMAAGTTARFVQTASTAWRRGAGAIATSSTTGTVKPDNSTITIDAAGTISSSGSSGLTYSPTCGDACRTGRFYVMPGAVLQTQTASTTRTSYTEFVTPNSISSATINISIGSGTAGTVHLGIYSNSSGMPGSRLCQGDVTIVAATAAVSGVACVVAMTPGKYWLASQFTAASTIGAAVSGSSSFNQPTSGTLGRGTASAAINVSQGVSVQSADTGGLPATATSPSLLEGILNVPVLALGF